MAKIIKRKELEFNKAKAARARKGMAKKVAAKKKLQKEAKKRRDKAIKEIKKVEPVFKKAISSELVTNRPKILDIDFELIYRLCMLGSTNEEIAGCLGITIGTFERYYKNYPEFRGTVLKGREEADASVAMRLYERAMGYEHDDEEIKVVNIGGGLGSSIERVRTRKHYAPDVQAIRYWLNNRQPDKWKERGEVPMEVPLNNSPPQLVVLTSDDIKKKLTEDKNSMKDETSD